MSVKLEFNTEELSERIRGRLQAELMALAEELAGRVQRGIRDKGGIATGTYVSTVAPSEVEGGVQVGSPVEYGEYYEFGTRPHWPPIEPLITWVDLKQLDRIELFVKTGRTSRLSNKVDLTRPRIRKQQLISPRQAQIVRIAHAIQRSIAKHGTRGRFVMRDALESLGLRYEVTRDESGSVYHIDVADYLSRTFSLEDV